MNAATDHVLTAITSSFMEWKGEMEQEQKIITAVKTRSVWGGNKSLRRQPPREYAESPLMDHIKNRGFETGKVFIAYVPNNMGKTTACYACLDKPYCNRGIAFSPEHSDDRPYFESMHELTGFEGAPPTGLLTLIVNELNETSTEDNNDLPIQNFMILDNFMSNGFNQPDLHLIQNLKAVVKEKVVSVLVFTPHKRAAGRLLSINGLEVVVPLATSQCIDALRNDYPDIDVGSCIDFDWEQHVSMEWKQEQLKKAVLGTTAFRILKESAQAIVRENFDEVYCSKLSDQQRKRANPSSMLTNDRFPGAMKPITTPRNATTPTTTHVHSSLPSQRRGCCIIS